MNVACNLVEEYRDVAAIILPTVVLNDSLMVSSVFLVDVCKVLRKTGTKISKIVSAIEYCLLFTWR